MHGKHAAWLVKHSQARCCMPFFDARVTTITTWLVSGRRTCKQQPLVRGIIIVIRLVITYAIILKNSSMGMAASFEV